VAQDGTRVRASAGASWFRREQTLQALMQEAREHLEAVKKEASDPAISARRAATRVILGVEVTPRGSDMGQAIPMLKRI